MKKRIKYTKNIDVSLVSHLDTLRVFVRAMRRAKMQTAYSDGFNPHPKITFLLPISVGFTSECELVDIVFINNYSNDEIKEMLNAALPSGFTVVSVYDGVKKINEIDSVYYEITFEQNVFEKLEAFLKLTSYIAVKKSKRKSRDVDIFSYVKDFQLNSNNCSICLNANGENSLNPKFFIDEFLKWADLSTEYHVHRKKICASDKKTFI